MDKFSVKCFEDMYYYEYLPKGFESSRPYPLMLFLHGAGERGLLEHVKRYGPLHEIEEGMELPFVIVAPYCEGSKTWFDYGERLGRFLETYRKKTYVDKEKIYCTGLSMGGFGTWSFGMSHPEWFAAIAPVCGGGMAWNTETLVKTPVWTFHGDCDDTVSIEETKRMVESLKGRGGNVRFTVYPGYNHDVWTVTYRNTSFYKWLLDNSRNEAYKLAENPDLG